MDIPDDVFLDSIDEPTMLVAQGRVAALNAPARDLFPGASPGRDIRFIIRHPAALGAVQRGRRADLDLERLGDGDKSWRLQLRPLKDRLLLLRFVDRSSSAAAAQMRTDFVADASHELRTPLAAIKGYAETLSMPDLDEEGHAHFLRQMASQVERMENLIDDLFTLSRVEAERFRLPDALVDMAKLAERAAGNCASHAERAGATIILELAPGLSPVRGDEGQLAQAIDNLLANAISHGCAKPGGSVRVEGREVGEMVRLTVSDDGEGVAEGLLPKLTQRFYRVDSARGRGKGGGTGLGLSIVRRIAERHRGRLELSSVPGEGLTAMLEIPARAVT